MDESQDTNNDQARNSDNERKQVKSRDWLFKSIPIILSTLALSLSITSFYFQFMRETHSVKATVAKFDLDDWATVKTSATARGVIVNAGNKYEIVNSTVLVGGDKSKLNNAAYITFGKKQGGPFVLKPSEAVPFEVIGDIEWAIKNEGRPSADKDTYMLDIGVDFLFVTPDGKEKRSTYWIGTLMYYELSDNFKFQPITTSANQWIELVH